MEELFSWAEFIRSWTSAAKLCQKLVQSFFPRLVTTSKSLNSVLEKFVEGLDEGVSLWRIYRSAFMEYVSFLKITREFVAFELWSVVGNYFRGVAVS